MTREDLLKVMAFPIGPDQYENKGPSDIQRNQARRIRHYLQSEGLRLMTNREHNEMPEGANG